MGKLKKPGRVKLICINCDSQFSTHSSKRKLCHKCLPKCRERHCFYPETKKVEKVEKVEGKTNKSIEQSIKLA